MTDARRIRVRLPGGKAVVARVHGAVGGETHILLPDGQLGIPDKLAYTTDPFRPATHDEIADDLLGTTFDGFRVRHTTHYVLIYQCTDAFAEESGQVLENLYKGLTDAFRKQGFPVRDAEFPLVAVIFKSESDFRAFKRVPPEVQAYYEIYTNRIHFSQASDRDAIAPEVAAVRRPQTVAHEGTHQILQNIGVHPRLAPWPPWLVEGLAEYCATPQWTRSGQATWRGIGAVNAQHLATIRDLSDPLSGQVPGAVRAAHIGRPPGMPLVEYLVTRTDLSPTDYALSWATTHYLAVKRMDAFVRYLKRMSAMPPFETRTPEQALEAFREAFGPELARLDREIRNYLAKLKPRDALPFYAVTFQQRMPGGMVRRAAMVSQSPSMIRQWLETVSYPRGDVPLWDAVPFPTRTRAWVVASEWVRGP